MNKKKTIIAAIVLLLVLLVGGAIAYFTDTDSAENTFTIGNVDIEVLEPTWTTTLNGETKLENMMPGDTAAKDPKVHNKSTTNPAYVFLKVEVPCTTANAKDSVVKEIFTYTLVENNGWNLMTDGSCDAGKVTRVYNYGTASAMTSLAADATTPELFASVTLNDAIDGDEDGITGDLKINITGYGIQATGLDVTAPAQIFAKFSA